MGITIIESQTFTRMANQIGDPKWIDELQESIVSTISANPFVGDPISQHIFIVKSISSEHRISRISIMYTYDPNVEPDYIELLTIELIG